MVNHPDTHSNMATGPTEQFVNVKLERASGQDRGPRYRSIVPKWTTENHLDVNGNEVEVLVLDDDN